MTGTVSVGWIHPGEWASCFGSSLIDLLFYDAAHDGRILRSEHPTIAKETGAAQIHAGRNRVVQSFLDETTADHLLMIDADMGFAPDLVTQLLAAAQPIVGGLAFAQKSDGKGDMYARRYRCTPTVYRMHETTDEIGFVPWFDYPRNELVEVDGTGAACVLICRDVLEAIRAEHGDHWYHPIELPKGPQGSTEFGEDLSFCIRAKACGFPIFVDTSVKTTHDKGGVFFDEETYDLQQAMKAVI